MKLELLQQVVSNLVFMKWLMIASLSITVIFFLGYTIAGIITVLKD